MNHKIKAKQMQKALKILVGTETTNHMIRADLGRYVSGELERLEETISFKDMTLGQAEVELLKKAEKALHGYMTASVKESIELDAEVERLRGALISGLQAIKSMAQPDNWEQYHPVALEIEQALQENT